MSFDANMGPVNYVVLTFESAQVPPGGAGRLLELVDAGRILLLDVEFVRKDEDGSFSTVSASEAGAEAFEGASTQLLDREDLGVVGDALVPGGIGVVVVYEDVVLLPVLSAWVAEGADVVAEGTVVVDELVEALGASGDA